MNTKKNNIKECQSDRHRITIIEDAINADGDAYQKNNKTYSPNEWRNGSGHGKKI